MNDTFPGVARDGVLVRFPTVTIFVGSVENMTSSCHGRWGGAIQISLGVLPR